jgi:hypothetical protein
MMMADLRDRFTVLDRVEVPDVWRHVEDLGPREPIEERSSTVTRVMAAIVALVIAGGGIALAVRSLGRSSPPLSSPPASSVALPADAIVFAQAESDSLDTQIEIAFVSAGGGDSHPLTTASKEGMVAAEPRWSPDGSQIAFVMSPRGHLTRYAGDGDIYVMDADGGDAC